PDTACSRRCPRPRWPSASCPFPCSRAARMRKAGREMTRFVALTLALITAVAMSAPPSRAQQSAVTAEEVVAALEAAYGVHPGQRRNHAKGTCALGTFVGISEAAAYSRSALFSGSPVPVVARFSLAGGDPEASDAERSPRGMALEFKLPKGDLQHITMINTPMFLYRTMRSSTSAKSAPR